MVKLATPVLAVLLVAISTGCVSVHKTVTGRLSPTEQDEFDRHMERGRSYAQLDQYAKADEEFSAALRVDSKSFAARLDKGTNLVHKGAFGDALRELDKAAKLNDESPKVYLWRGACHFAQEEFNAALSDLDYSLLLAPEKADRIEALFYLARTHGEMRDYETSRKRIREALELDPANEKLKAYLEALNRKLPD